jgi:hypothetical protein
MSRQNVELAKRLIRDFNRRDLAAVTAAFDPEIEWRPVGPAAVERAVYRGPRPGLGRDCRELGRLGGVSPRGSGGS